MDLLRYCNKSTNVHKHAYFVEAIGEKHQRLIYGDLRRALESIDNKKYFPIPQLHRAT